MGRKPDQYVPKAYDYRRVIFLVQVLALDKQWSDKVALFHDLYSKWGVQDRHGRRLEHMPDIDVLEELAVFALDYTRDILA